MRMRFAENDDIVCLICPRRVYNKDARATRWVAAPSGDTGSPSTIRCIYTCIYIGSADDDDDDERIGIECAQSVKSKHVQHHHHQSYSEVCKVYHWGSKCGILKCRQQLIILSDRAIQQRIVTPRLSLLCIQYSSMHKIMRFLYIYLYIYSIAFLLRFWTTLIAVIHSYSLLNTW